jgi:hypothetical protein
VFTAVAASGSVASEREADEASLSASRLFTFDIPAQPLASALETYSSVTGIEAIYGSEVAGGRRSAEVRGTFSAVEALRTLLSGTSLIARPIAQDAVTIDLLQTTDAPVTGPSPDKSVHSDYFSLIQSGLERAFCNDDQVRPGGYRAVLKFTITASGQIRQPSVVGTTGSEVRDRMIARKLDGMLLGNSPPAGLQQPIIMVILPQTSGAVLNCASIH